MHATFHADECYANMTFAAARRFLTAFALSLLSITPLLAAEVKKPNIVFLLADDLGGADLRCYGHPYARTPNLDSLASEGTRFKQFYSTGGTCCPARTGFMSAKFTATYANYPASAGFGDRITITELLKKNGYHTGHFGKWHIGPEPKPGTYGIDAINTGNEPSATSKRNDARGRDANIYDQAIAFIEKNKDHPFYLNVWGHITHNPVNPNQALVDKWSALTIKEEDFPAPMREKFDRVRKAGGDVNDAMRRYLADVESLDDAIGRLLKRIDELGLRDNTIVVFSSDQGAYMLTQLEKDASGATKIKKGGNKNKPNKNAATDMPETVIHNLMGYNGPHRGGKHTFLEGGVRAPFLIRWPGKVPAARVDETSVISGIDWLPTLCAITDIKINLADFDGENVSAAWLGAEHTRSKPLFWKTHAKKSDAVIRDGPWKLLQTRSGSVELYNIPSDPMEKTNVLTTHPIVAKKLEATLNQWKATLPKEYFHTKDKED
jgi:N-acetylgalactosamine-6-sulfatase